MYMRAPRSLFGSLLATTLALTPAVLHAQSQTKNDSNWSMNRSTYNEFNSGVSARRLNVMQTLYDKGFTRHELIKIYPLLIDLRDERDMCNAKLDAIYADLAMTRRGHEKLTADTRAMDCERSLADKQNKTWNVISDRVGSDKAMALRRLVEPTTENVAAVAYTDTTIQRIDTMLKDLDRMSAARIAANGGNPDNSGVRTASVETTTTTTTYTPTPIYVTTSAPVNERELVEVVRDRIVSSTIGNSDAIIFMPMHRDLTSPDMTFLWDEKWNVWF